MMIGTTLSFKTRKSFKVSSANLTVIFILITFVVGYIIGISLISGNNSYYSEFAKSMFDSITALKNSSFWHQTYRSIVGLALFLFCSYFFGTSVLGCVAIPTVCFLKGLTEGLIITYIYSTYSLYGMGFVALVLAPFFVVSSFLLILACRESACFSRRILNNTLPRGTSYNLFVDFKLYSIRYLFILLVCIVSAILNSAISSLFFRYFKF